MRPDDVATDRSGWMVSPRAMNGLPAMQGCSHNLLSRLTLIESVGLCGPGL